MGRRDICKREFIGCGVAEHETTRKHKRVVADDTEIVAVILEHEVAAVRICACFLVAIASIHVHKLRIIAIGIPLIQAIEPMGANTSEILHEIGS